MIETSARLLRLLSLLQVRPDWAGNELARRLAVTPRTLRRDVQKLRGLGYPVYATPGAAGGYRLGSGAALPPLLLDAESLDALAFHLGHLGCEFTVLGPPELIERVRTLAGRWLRAAAAAPES